MASRSVTAAATAAPACGGDSTSTVAVVSNGARSSAGGRGVGRRRRASAASTRAASGCSNSRWLSVASSTAPSRVTVSSSQNPAAPYSSRIGRTAPLNTAPGWR